MPVNESNGLISGIKKVPNKVNRFRPQFKPDGSLLTLKRATNELIISEVSLVHNVKNQEVKKSYQGLTDVFLKHSQIIEGHKDMSEELNNLRIEEPEDRQ